MKEHSLNNNHNQIIKKKNPLILPRSELLHAPYYDFVPTYTALDMPKKWRILFQGIFHVKSVHLYIQTIGRISGTQWLRELV